MTNKFLDLSRTTLNSAGQPDFGDPALTPLTEELTALVSGGAFTEEHLDGKINSKVCVGSNTGCSNTGDCTGTTRNTGCSNGGTCYYENVIE